MGTPILFGTNNDQNIIAQVEYDKAGRSTAQRDPRGKRTTYAYDQLNRRVSLTDPLNYTWLTTYVRLDGGGSRLTLTNPLSAMTQQDSDRLGRLSHLSYLNESTKVTPDITFSYDKKGSRTRMAEANGASLVRDTHYTYDQARRLKQVDFDNNGDGIIDQSVAYQYDAGGLRTGLTLPGGKTVAYQYNANQQLTGLTDWSGQVTSNVYDSLGRLVALTRSNGATSQYQYDSLGRLRLLRHTANGKTLAHHAYTVDARGNRTQALEVLAKASTGTTTLAYNDPAVSYYIGVWTAAAPYQTTLNISAALQVLGLGTTLTLTMGQGPDHSLYDIHVDNTLWQSVDGYATAAGDRVLSIPVSADGPHVIEVRNRPEKNAASSGYLLRFKSLVVSGQQYDAQTIQYQYDALARLIQSRYGIGTNTLGTASKEYDYAYDVAGNRTQQVVSLGGAPTPTTYTYDDANHLVSDGTHSFGYDVAGRLTSYGVNTYGWDRANRLLSMGGSAYQYNGLGQRVQQTVSAQVTQYLLDVQPGLEKVLQATTGVNTTSYVHGPLGIHAQQNPDASWHWPLQDGLGSVRAVLDNTATQQETRVYSPFGEPTQTSGTGQQTVFGFTGEPTDANGLVNLRARYYNPTLGIFPNLDLLEGNIGSPLSFNRYAYVQGNPVNRRDPSGLIGEQPPGCSSGQKCCGPDVTDWFLEELHIHANWVDQNIRVTDEIGAYCRLSFDPNNCAVAGFEQALFDFRNYAKAIPHKWMNFASTGISCPSSDCYRSVTLCGKCIDRAKMGDMIFGVAGIRAGYDAAQIWDGGHLVAGGLRDHDSQSTTGIGINIGLDVLRISNTSDLCNRIQNSHGTWAGLPGSGWESAAPWEWQYANDSVTDHSTPSCSPCSTRLSTSYPHTRPTLAGSATGMSPYADKPGALDAFFINQIPGLQYLDPCLCNGISDPALKQQCFQMTGSSPDETTDAICKPREFPG